MKNEVLKVKKSSLREQSITDEIKSAKLHPCINRYSELLALKLVQKEKKVLEDMACPKCYVSISKEVKKGNERPRTVEDRIVSKGLSPYFRKISYKAGCNVAKIAGINMKKKTRHVKFNKVK